MDLVSNGIKFSNIQKSGSTGKSRHRRKHSVEIDNRVLENEFNQNGVTANYESKAANFQSVSEPASSPSTSLQAQNVPQIQQNMREEWAAIRIQTAFRGFLVIGQRCMSNLCFLSSSYISSYSFGKLLFLSIRQDELCAL